jgi:hypothetical protein
VVAAWRRASCSGFSGSKFEGGACVVMRRYVPVAKLNFYLKDRTECKVNGADHNN